MKIGIVDNDFLFTYSAIPLLNVEIMKMCEYYTQNYHEPEILTLNSKFDEYDKLIVVSNRIDINNKLQKKIDAYKKDIEYFGAIFNNYRNMPLPKEMAEMPIKTKYYKDLIKIYPRIKNNNRARSLNRNYVRIYAFGKNHIQLKDILDDRKYLIMDNDLFTKANFTTEVLMYLMMFPKNFKFAYPQIVTSFKEFELYVQMYEFGYRSLRMDLMISESEEWIKILDKYEDWIFSNYLTGEGKVNFRIGYDPNNCYDDDFFMHNIVETLKIIKANLKIGFHKSRRCLWQFALKTEWSGYFAIYREMTHFAFETMQEGTYSFINFLRAREQYITENSDFWEVNRVYKENEEFKKEMEEEIYVKRKRKGGKVGNEWKSKNNIRIGKEFARWD